MLRGDSGNRGSRRGASRNVLGEPLDLCSITPMTGFYRDGCCNTGQADIGSHTVCAVMTAAFLDFSKSRGNDLSHRCPSSAFRACSPAIAGVYVHPVGMRHSRRVKHPVWSYVPLTKPLSPIAL